MELVVGVMKDGGSRGRGYNFDGGGHGVGGGHTLSPFFHSFSTIS